jgi:hypothetical protein
MTTPRRWKFPPPLPRRLSGVLAVVTCLCVGAAQAADIGPRHHAQGEYDAATATYVVAAGDDLDAIAERFEIPVAELMRENQLTSTVIQVGQKLALAGAAPATAAPTYMPDIPAKITTPETVETRIGTLHFPNGVPDAETAEKVYDQLDFGRGVDAFLRGMSATSVHALCAGFEDAGIETNKGLGITADLMNARQLFLTANTTTVYVTQCLDLGDGPIVVRVPPKILGMVDDADFRWVTDLGLTSPDKGAGGDFLFIPPGYDGDVPFEGYYVQKTRTNRLFLFYRAFVEKGGIAAAVEYVKAKAGVFPLSEAGSPPAPVVVNISDLKLNTISANDFSFYDELNAVVQGEPADWVDPDTVGLYASIGIRKGQLFAPDERMKTILTDAVALGNAIARTSVFAPRDPAAKIYPDQQWQKVFVGNSYRFLNGAERLLDARIMFFYYATGITPAMVDPKPGTGSVYAITLRDQDGAYLDGGKTYKLTLPGPIPAKHFWSFTVYDNQTRSLLPTDQKLAGVDGSVPGLEMNQDGGVTVWFGPKAPEGHEKNWVQTMPGGGYNIALRLYGPLEPWFDQSWRPGDPELQP